MTRVKICGITQLSDALAMAQMGAELIGLNFYKKSPRYLAPDDAQTLVHALRHELGQATPTLVGVFVNEAVGTVDYIIRHVGLDFVQLCGDESLEMFQELRGRAFKAIQPMNAPMGLEDARYFAPTFIGDERAPSLLLDAYHPQLRGGTGETASVEVALAIKAQVPRLMLAGGLTPDNVQERVQAIAPWGVDVASGVESGSPGIKDLGKVRAFIDATKAQ
jgi:phosphoribosylanthranilate isomerase